MYDVITRHLSNHDRDACMHPFQQKNSTLGQVGPHSDVVTRYLRLVHVCVTSVICAFIHPCSSLGSRALLRDIMTRD